VDWRLAMRSAQLATRAMALAAVGVSTGAGIKDRNGVASVLISA